MRKFFALLTLACGLAFTSGCVVVGGTAVAAAGIAYSSYNDAFTEFDAGMFEVCTAINETLTDLGVDRVKKSTHPEESVYKFEYQNLKYTVKLDHLEISNTRITIGAVSNVVFKNKVRAGEMIMKIEDNL